MAHMKFNGSKRATNYLSHIALSHTRRYKYEFKINQLRKMIEKEVGHPVSLKRSPTGSLEITPELLKEVPNIEQ